MNRSLKGKRALTSEVVVDLVELVSKVVVDRVVMLLVVPLMRLPCHPPRLPYHISFPHHPPCRPSILSLNTCINPLGVTLTHRSHMAPLGVLLGLVSLQASGGLVCGTLSVYVVIGIVQQEASGASRGFNSIGVYWSK